MSNLQLRNLEIHWGALVAKSWDDASYKVELLSNPAAALQESGYSLPADSKVTVVEDVSGVEFAGNVIKLPLPAKPGVDEFSDEEITFENILKYAEGGNCTDLCNCVC